MEIISISRPSLHGNEWKQCVIKSISLKPLKNQGTIVVKGVSHSIFVTTSITFSNLKQLIDGDEIRSDHGYFKLKIPKDLPEYKPTIKLFQQLTKIKF